MLKHLKRKFRKWLIIAAVGFLGIMLIFAGVSSIGGGIMSLLLSWQSQTCDQQTDSSSGNLSVSGYSKNVISKAVAASEAVGADLKIKPALVFAQLAAETGMQDTTEVREDNNFGGIKYSSTFSDVATPGNISPEGDHYAHFKSISGFATIYRNTIKNMLGGKKPSTWREFVVILKSKGYMGDNVDHYVSLGQNWYANYNKLAKKYGKGKIKLSASNNGSNSDATDSSSDGSSTCPNSSDDSQYSGTWTWPFKSIKSKPASLDGGQYGHTSYSRGQTNFHDGFDFSNGLNGVHNGSDVIAVTSGTIYKVGYDSAALHYIWEKAGDYNIIYQEGFNSSSDIHVHKGDKVKIGQKIGTITGTHVHLGITTNKKNPTMNQIGSPVANGFDHPNCWLDPIKVIQHGLKK
ncbi:peptidoglycan DD-metalloendopeptidase family protein (plasmid) [Lactobacillus sp. ESL0731]|uniref:M23 family metallopeptidase n=1 Tax=unclassified Lactobacillus TaxID=2620435 RepID=UPI0023F6914D|nr:MULTISPECIES: peptidoglycan DD-metalloendopeptidase family protein [unclassified Lactobacillus]WEV52104.1 peptidoglycan DD-metalloendopeptidase family protein [Lactobacillus sp. ESL0700]WEV63263.1 peptidoglycan DD-metalloendopeptidase family protein [Lactobacillus sp. ESL0731]